MKASLGLPSLVLVAGFGVGSSGVVHADETTRNKVGEMLNLLGDVAKAQQEKQKPQEEQIIQQQDTMEFTPGDIDWALKELDEEPTPERMRLLYSMLEDIKRKHPFLVPDGKNDGYVAEYNSRMKKQISREFAREIRKLKQPK